MKTRRMVSSKICIDEKISSLSVKDRWLFVSILVNLDEYGRITGDVYEIKMTAVPADPDYTSYSIRKSLYRFQELGLILWEEDKVCEFINFEKYQTFQHRRKNSVYPTLKARKPEKKVILQSTEEFAEFWDVYPKGRKFNKIKMGQTYQQVLDNGVKHTDLMKALNAQKKKWGMVEPHLIPHMSTWLNQCRWEMEVEVSLDTVVKNKEQELICSECEHKFKIPYSNDQARQKRCPKCNEYGCVDMITYNLMKGSQNAKQTSQRQKEEKAKAKRNPEPPRQNSSSV